MSRSPPAAIVASDLERAVETARIVSVACGVPVETDAGLREVDVGSWTGKGYDEVAELYPEEWAAWESGLDVRRGGGETYGELADRIEATIARITRRLAQQPQQGGAAGQRVLLVSHGGAIKSWIARILGVAPKGLRALSAVANCGLTVVEAEATERPDARHRLHVWNDTAHLEGLRVDEHSD
jgi:probable phosphoglycerate mutase